MKGLFRSIRSGEGRIVSSLLVLLALNTCMLEMAEVVATAGFISNVGTPQIVGLWVVDVVITLFAASGFALIVDRIARTRLVSWMLLASGCMYAVLLGLFTLELPGWITYTLLYILSDQQYVVFPLAFWALANDLFSLSEGKRLFPLIAAGSAFGNLLGNGIAALAVLFLQNGYHLLIVNIGLCFAGWILIKAIFGAQPLRARQSKQQLDTWRETLAGGTDVIRHVPLFRYLAWSMIAAGISLAILEYHFLWSIDSLAQNNPLQLQSIYGSYKVGLFIAILLFQWFISGRWMERVGTKQTFIVLPAGLLLALGSVFVQPITGGLVGRFVARLLQTAWDEPARKSVQGLVPDERRGRVSVVLDSYCYALATIVGCAILGTLIGLQAWGWLHGSTIIWIYLACAAVATMISLWTSLRLRAAYDTSLLNWRLARSRRRSVLDGIEF